ncbi:hypothetical protein ACTFIU_008395 [Dictyostelium citrinum]
MQPPSRISRQSLVVGKKSKTKVNQRSTFINLEDEKKEKHRLVEAKGRGRRIQLYEKLNRLLKEVEKKIGKEIPSEVIVIQDDLIDDRRKIYSNRKKYNNEDILRKIHVLVHIWNCITAKKNDNRSIGVVKKIDIPSTTKSSTSYDHTISHFPTPPPSPRDIDVPTTSDPELPNKIINYEIIHLSLSSELENLANFSTSCLTQPETKHEKLIDLYFSSFDL